MKEVAQTLGADLGGDGSVVVTRLAHPADVRSVRDLVLAMDPALMPLLADTAIEAVIVPKGADVPSSIKAWIEVGRSRVALAQLTRLFEEPVEVPEGIHPTAVIEEGAYIAPDVRIGAFSYICAGAEVGVSSVIHPQVYIGPCASIGAGSLIYAGARIGARVKIGARAIVHFNASIGADGFSFVTPQTSSVEAARETGFVGGAKNLELMRIASLGAVEIGDDVEIGANTSIDRGTIVSTRIGSGTKIDNQVQVGHNVVIGENCMICGRVGIAGSAVIGNRVVLGGAVGVADHVRIGDDTVAMAMSGIAGNIAPRSLVGGAPAKPRKKIIEDMRALHRVKPLAEKVDMLTKRLEALEGKKSGRKN